MSITLLFIALLLWALVIVLLLAVEHGYLSSTPARWLYNVCAPFYQGKWKRNREEYSDATTSRLFLVPIFEALARTSNQRVIDLGCGTGRLSLALLRDARFSGVIDACDFSTQMLKIFQTELLQMDPEIRSRLTICEQNLEAWRHSPEVQAGAVLLIEAGEFVVNIQQLLREISAAVVPGGIVLITKPKDWYARLLIGRPLTRSKLTAKLSSLGFHDISFHPWTSRHEVVWARRV